MTRRVVIAACVILMTCVRTAGLGAGEPLFSSASGTMVRKWTRFGALTKALRNAGPDAALFLDDAGAPLKKPPLDRCLVIITFDGSVAIDDSTYDYERLDEPYDIWIAPDGGVYFIHSGISLSGEARPWGTAVYYLSPERDWFVRVAGDLAAPVTLIGASDGATLYVIQENAEESMLYRIAPDGSLVEGIRFALEPCERC